MQEHGIDGVQLTQQLQGISVSARHVSQLELTKYGLISQHSLLLKENSYFITCQTSLTSPGNLSGGLLGKKRAGNG